jgi:signal peptidase I
VNFNFALILFWLMVGTGLIWLLDRFYFKPRRRVVADAALAQLEEQTKLRMNADQSVLSEERAHLWQRHMKQPAWIEFTAGFFPVILIVFGLRSFLFEPFRIPSGSMIPTLLVGDLILVNKFSYGVRLPILNQKIIPVGEPQRGDVMVFRYPEDPSLDYIKRVIGLPGDKIAYENKRLTVNGELVAEIPLPDYFDKERVAYSKQLTEKLPASNGAASATANTVLAPVVEHNILKDGDSMAMITPSNFPFRENCSYTASNTAVACTVPAGHYFMMGDNRDNSADSRYWGFVPDKNIVGKAFFIWMNFGNIGRIGFFH